MEAELIVQKVLDIYIYVLSISGIVSFFILVIAGNELQISSGDPEKVKNAKSKIFNVFLGLAILFTGYILLNTINPSILNIDLEQPDQIILEPTDKPESKILVADLLGTIRDTSYNLINISQAIKSTSSSIKNATNTCSCLLTSPVCICEGTGGSSDCKASRCYSKNNKQPCRDGDKIDNYQRIIIAWYHELVYYKNRGLGERAGLMVDISNLRELETFWSEKILIETNASLKEQFEKGLVKVKREIELKKDISAELGFISGFVKISEKPIKDMAELPNQCITGIKDACVGRCFGTSKACSNDTRLGCQPIPGCGLKNPCPFVKINITGLLIKQVFKPIEKSANKIINSIEELIRLKTIII